MPRAVKEWIGKTPDSKPPASVRQRVYDRYKGICVLTGLPINGKKWECHHIQALWKGGENRESNLGPALYEAHRQETTKDKAQKALEDAQRQKHIGAHKSKRPMNRGYKTEKPKSTVSPTKLAGLKRGEIARRYGAR